MSALSSITLEESKRLIELEEKIERGLTSFMEVGSALAEIKERELFRTSYSTFEEYCREEWEMSPVHAWRLTEAAKAVENVSTLPMGNVPINERQARPLTTIKDPELQREAWQEAVESAPNGKPTAKDVEAAVERVQSGETKAERIHFKPSNGLQYADLAISTLKKIQPNDTERKAALNKVLKFIQNSL